jgi:hypothetical protein
MSITDLVPAKYRIAILAWACAEGATSDEFVNRILKTEKPKE